MNKISLALFSLVVGLALVANPVGAAAPDGAGPWADSVVSSSQALRKNGTAVLVERSNTAAVLGVAETTGTVSDTNTTASNFYSLGFGGSIVVGFDNAIANGVGNDFQVYEVTGGTYADEAVQVEASHNGTDWWMLSSSVARDAALDLGILPCANYVRITDVSNPALFESTADGYDLDAVMAINTTSSCSAESSILVNKSADMQTVNPGTEVTYTYEVSNTGNFDLNTVVLMDDMCSPVSSPAGDDGDSILENGEVWTYTCMQNLDQTTTNIATVTAQDPWNNQVQDTDEVTVTVEVAGCTYTQGYWKNHSLSSKSPNQTWTQLTDASAWLTVLKTSAKGNAWYQLAHQYVAAQLNVLNGAYTSPAVAQAIADAGTALGGSTPFTVAQADKAMFVELATILTGFNEGLTVTPHCSN